MEDAELAWQVGDEGGIHNSGASTRMAPSPYQNNTYREHKLNLWTVDGTTSVIKDTVM